MQAVLHSYHHFWRPTVGAINAYYTRMGIAVTFIIRPEPPSEEGFNITVNPFASEAGAGTVFRRKKAAERFAGCQTQGITESDRQPDILGETFPPYNPSEICGVEKLWLAPMTVCDAVTPVVSSTFFFMGIIRFRVTDYLSVTTLTCRAADRYPVAEPVRKVDRVRL